MTSFVLVLASCVVPPGSASAQYEEVPNDMPVVTDGRLLAATQIGSTLFVGGAFSRLSAPTGGAVVVSVAGTYERDRFPRFSGPVSQILPDGMGGWFVVGGFSRVNGEPFGHVTRVTPERTIDRRYRIDADGMVRRVALAHGRLYLVGDFTTINGVARRQFAVLDAASGQLTTWDPGFASDTWIGGLSYSSLGVYLTGSAGSQPRVWGFDAGSGRLLFRRIAPAQAVAASSQRIYLAGTGSARPLWAIDPLSGDDLPWSPGFGFRYLPATYGLDATTINDVYLDGQRLFFTGRFLTTDGRTFVTAVDVASGAAIGWRPLPDAPWSAMGARVTRLGPAIVVTDGPKAFDAATAAPLSFAPATFGTVRAMALAPEGAVIGGDFDGIDGTPRQGLAAIDLRSATVVPWASPFAAAGLDVSQLSTDGAWLFARTEGTLGGVDARIAKIDPVSGTVVAERTWPSIQTRMEVDPARGWIVVTTLPRASPTVGEIGVVRIADWSYRPLPVSIDGGATSLALDDRRAFVSGRFETIGGKSRPRLAAIDLDDGQVLDWRPNPDAAGAIVRAEGGRVWVGGEFRRVGGQRRRGVAELDRVSGAALAWNPDVLGVVDPDGFVGYGVHALALGPDRVFLAVGMSSPFPGADMQRSRPTVGGRRTGPLVALRADRSRVGQGPAETWRPTDGDLIAVLPDCLLTTSGCLARAVAEPQGLTANAAGADVSLSWTLPSPWQAVRLEVGSREAAADLLVVDLAPGQTSFASPAPPGRYFARVRSLVGPARSVPSSDVSFVVGPPDVPGAPLDSTAVVDGARVRVQWRPSSHGPVSWYELEGGSGPGLSNLARVVVPGSESSAEVTAPPGLYWARVVAVNAEGRSAPGSELLIDTRPRQSCSAVPVAPENLTATVVGRLVTLTWQQPPGLPQVDALRILAGSAPDRQDIASIDVPFMSTSTQVTAPPGTYYVRIAADSGCVAQALSNEIAVTVP